MRILNRNRLEVFIKRYPNSASSLKAWVQIMENNDFAHFIDLKTKIGSADYVKPNIVFNIAGNKFRLIALINYALKTISVEAVMTHKEYDKGKWRK